MKPFGVAGIQKQAHRRCCKTRWNKGICVAQLQIHLLATLTSIRTPSSCTQRHTCTLLAIKTDFLLGKLVEVGTSLL
jgi:hypothetical protein